MTTFSSTIDANSFQANDLLEKGERRSVRVSGHTTRDGWLNFYWIALLDSLWQGSGPACGIGLAVRGQPASSRKRGGSHLCRSEERRVGKEGRSRWSPYH